MAPAWLPRMQLLTLVVVVSMLHHVESFVRPIWKPKSSWLTSMTTLLSGSMMPPSSSSSLEVEVKFSVSNLTDIEHRLRQLSFQPTSTIEMVDWYFDTRPDYRLVLLQDWWLRYRDNKNNNNKEEGQWELKRGRRQTSGAMTVYEEVKGPEAVAMAVAALQGFDLAHQEVDHEYMDQNVPLIPIPGTGLIPFARIFTRRSRWSRHGSPACEGLVVDLDVTDDGHAVGEVETIVTTEGEVADAQARIQTFLQELLGNQTLSSSPVAKGKVEDFLEKYRPELFSQLVAKGRMGHT